MILIKDSLVIDGTGTPGKRVDILLKDNRISAVGYLKNQEADVVINGLGMIATPGFIDVNTDSDHYLSLFSDPLQQDFLLQGVTTIIGGQCGSSLAPLLYGTLESVRKWADTDQINVDWNTVAEYLKTLEKIKLGVNFGTLVGHSTIRRAIVGEDARDLTTREMAVFSEVLERALKEGALGFSTGLGYSHSKLTPYYELKTLVGIAAKRNGICATHLRDERADVVAAAKEVIQLARESGVSTIISHFRPIKGTEEQYQAALALIEEAGQKEKLNIHFDLYPFDYSMVPMYMLLPEWARTGKSLAQMNAQFDEPHLEEEIIAELPNFKAEDFVIARAAGFDYLVGKNIGEFAKSQGVPLKKALPHLMRMTKLKAVLFYRNINLALAKQALNSEQALVASNSPSLVEAKNVLENDRAKHTFQTFLSLFNGTTEHSLEWAVQKATQKAAQKYHLKDRGVIKEGAIADLALHKDGMAQHVFLAGNQVVKDGVATGERRGAVLRS